MRLYWNHSLAACAVLFAFTACVPAGRPELIDPTAAPLAPTCAIGIALYDARPQAPGDSKDVAKLSTSKTGLEAVQLLKKQAAEVGATGMIFGNNAADAGGVTILGSGTVRPNDSRTTTDALAVYSASDAPRVRTLCGLK